jgi:2-polyprenyl-6-methoxyphenol hydroxylase-like FAD-dependent oxidoreductase
VGQALAILLGARGWRVGVFEKRPAPYPLPRAVHYDGEVARILQALGVADALAPTIEPADAYEWRNAAGQVLLRFASRPMGASGWPDASMFSQPDLERLLDERARACSGVTVRRGHEVVDLQLHDDGARVDVRGADGTPQGVAARFVIGCDGANSTIRAGLGMPVVDLGFFFDWLIVDVVPRVPVVWSPTNVQICDPARPTTLVSGGRGRRRWEFMRLPDESLEELAREDTAWQLLAPWGVTPDDATLERHAVYRFQARWVDRWRHGPALLAGDAAHQMPPFAGQGMCSGLRDAVNLAWKLDLVRRGAAPDSLLDTYAAERIPHVRATIDFSMELGKIICVPDPASAAARDAQLMAALARDEPTPPPPGPRLGPGVFSQRDPLAGRPFVQGRVRQGGQVGLFDDVVGRGWVLVAWGGGESDPLAGLPADLARFFSSIGGIAVRMGPALSLEDLDGRYAAWFVETGSALVLQRPDFQVFGACRSAADAEALLGELRELLA